jgi:phosphatidylserine decarboxylase
MDGSLVIIRLAPADYHRYHFPLSEMSSNTKIDGDYCPVNPLALRKMAEIFLPEQRAYDRYKPCVWKCYHGEVGATMVRGIMKRRTKNA